RAALEVVEGRLVWGDHAGSGASLDGHVADGHAGFHRQLLDGLATVLNDVPLAAAGADLRDDGEDQVLGGDTRLQLAADLDGHGLEGLQRQGLGGQHVLDLGGADAHGDGAEGTVGGGVGVTTHHRHSRLSQAELWSDGVDDALIDVAHRVQADAKLFGVLAQSRDLQARSLVLDVQQVSTDDASRGDVVVLGCDGQVRTTDRAAGLAQPVEGLRRGDLVDEVEVDVQQVRVAVRSTGDEVVAPDLLGERQRLFCCAAGGISCGVHYALLISRILRTSEVMPKSSPVPLDGMYSIKSWDIHLSETPTRHRSHPSWGSTPGTRTLPAPRSQTSRRSAASRFSTARSTSSPSSPLAHTTCLRSARKLACHGQPPTGSLWHWRS